MDIHAGILEDFGRALADMHAVLAVKTGTKKVQDALVFSFIRANDVFRVLIRNIYAENSDDEVMDPEQMLIALCALEVISDEQAKRLMEQSAAADLLTLDRSWLDDQEDVEIYEQELAALPTYYEDMSILLNNLSNIGTLVSYEEHYEGH